MWMPRGPRSGQIYGRGLRRRRVVDGVDFEVDQGEIVGLLGPNGAGKTTSFRMACGMIEPNAGHVMLNDVDVTRWPMYRRAREGGMGYLAQESSVFRKLSVENNLLGMMEMLNIGRCGSVSFSVSTRPCGRTPACVSSASSVSSV